jgi:hypothetical protein
MRNPMTLQLNIEKDLLWVTVLNTGREPLRLWSRTCSWGWSIFSLLLAPASVGTPWREYRVKPIRWTRNVPKAIEIPASGFFAYPLTDRDTRWEGLDASDALLQRALEVRVRLRIDSTPEALSQNVFIGEALSADIPSHPPHGWLFGR